MSIASNSSSPPAVVVLFGPTAVGKTDVISQLVEFRPEIISADSLQVYRGLCVGAAKPSKCFLNSIPHHLLDIKKPDQQFTAGDFVRAADRLVPEIQKRGSLPIVSGGTAYYIRGFLYGLPEAPPSSETVRRKIRQDLDSQGIEHLYNELKKIDPVTAGRVSSSDPYRIQRALEVYRVSGRPLSCFRVPGQYRTKFRMLKIGLQRPRAELKDRIGKRVRDMFENGLIEEVSGLLASGFQEQDPGLRGIGYREFLSMLQSGCHTLKDIEQQICRNTRRYAKRQMTFFRRFPHIHWVYAGDYEAIARKVCEFVNSGPQ